MPDVQFISLFVLCMQDPSSQLAPATAGFPEPLPAKGVSVGGILQVQVELDPRPDYNFVPFNSMLLPYFGHGLAPTPPNLSLKFKPLQCGAAEDVEKIGAVSVGDSWNRDFTRWPHALGGGN